ncbi:MAG: hypothetical protein GY750_16330 [Lentisphaerae bacterium]|nr:hypothetical protein [Lentisphaerota bacterium]
MNIKKKNYIELQQVKAFIADVPFDVKVEYDLTVEKLEAHGRLTRPFGEKVDGTLFAIRIIQTANIRVFYVYGYSDNIYGIHAYHKKSQKIPLKEKKQAEKKIKLLKQQGMIR